ncbi:MAG: phosphoenolpyruvate carboxykinase (ATP) [Anaerolineales bacterium]|nr:phosphoenolpyruvate carboxykinase (ATP) [Anaerolineales bacterium]
MSTDNMETFRKSSYGLDAHGLYNLKYEFWNLGTEALIEHIIKRGEGILTQGGAVAVTSGKHTARAARDKFFVREPSTEGLIDWGEYNQPISQASFDTLYGRVQSYLQGKDVFVQDVFAGADQCYRHSFRIITEHAWQSLFSHTMLNQPEDEEKYREFIPEFTLISVPSMAAFPPIEGVRSETAIVVNLGQRLALIVNTGYGGEIKKTVFTIMNYLLPLKGVMPMHCSASIGPDGDGALFFGLSGTGKTTLSADPQRRLIGDDEHGWSDNGLFNFEDGCYAKVINLSEEDEPDIYACTQRYGTILENVIYDPETREIDLFDASITRNTRASYPLPYIPNAALDKVGPQPRNIIMLTCDASGVMPPIALLDPTQAIYHFISGYTSKTGGTEAGVGDAPEKTFSACFGAPFMVHKPTDYADLLRNKIIRHEVRCWLLNTGWVGGSYGIGKRISIKYTRALLKAALSGALLKESMHQDPVFGFMVPDHCEGVPDAVLDPSASWEDKEAYLTSYRELAASFQENFLRYQPYCPPGFLAGGPKL